MYFERSFCKPSNNDLTYAEMDVDIASGWFPKN